MRPADAAIAETVFDQTTKPKDDLELLHEKSKKKSGDKVSPTRFLFSERSHYLSENSTSDSPFFLRLSFVGNLSEDNPLCLCQPSVYH